MATAASDSVQVKPIWGSPKRFHSPPGRISDAATKAYLVDLLDYKFSRYPAKQTYHANKERIS